jgi:hypothetical protein
VHNPKGDFSAAGGTNIFFTARPVYTTRAGTGTTSTLAGVGDGTLSYQDDGNLYSGPGQVWGVFIRSVFGSLELARRMDSLSIPLD